MSAPWTAASKEKQRERIYKLLNPNGDPFAYSPKANPELELIGLILWATEGDKTQISLANGNPRVIQMYLKFLRKICRLREDKIKVVIHCHDTLPYKSCLTFWSNITGIEPDRFRKPYIKRDKGGERKYPYGICRIVASNTKLVALLKQRLTEIGMPRDYDYKISH
jgi:hypothetical protein